MKERGKRNLPIKCYERVGRFSASVCTHPRNVVVLKFDNSF